MVEATISTGTVFFLSASTFFITFSFALTADTWGNATQAAYSDHDHGVFYAVSAASNGAISNGSSYYSAVSAFGKYVVFVSTANNFGTQDMSTDADVFMKSTRDGTISLISCGGTNDVYSHGSASKPYSYMNPPAVSASGRFVAFEFDGALGSNDTNGVYDIFLRDTWRKETKLISVSAAGVQGNNVTLGPDISADGRFITFQSYASNLIPADTNNSYDVFLKDAVTGAVTCVSTSGAGVQGDSWSFQPSISADGRYVAFTSTASNLVTGDANGKNDIFVKDTLTGSTSRVSTGIGSEPNGDSYYPDISADGRYVAFRSTATNLVAGDSNGADDIFVKDMTTGATVLASASQDGAIADKGTDGAPNISDDGRYVAFESKASNLTEGDTNGQSDIFRKDIQSGAIIIMSIGQDGSAGNGASTKPSLSPDGNFVSFTSSSNNLMPGDTNGLSDIFLASATALGPGVAITSPPEKDWLGSDSLMIEADLIDSGSGIDEASAAFQVDGLAQDGCSVADSHFSCQVSGLAHGVHPFTITVKDLAGKAGYGYGTVNIDHIGPSITKIIPSGEWVSLPANIWVDIRDDESGTDRSSVAFLIDGSPVTACSWYNWNMFQYHCGSNELAQGEHSFRYSVSDKAGNTSILDGIFKVDSIPPKISNTQPQGQIEGPDYTITADLSDAGSGINTAGILLIVNGTVVNSGITVTNGILTYNGSGLGEQSVLLRARDVAGHEEIAEWKFTTTTDKISYFPWYDSKYGKTWVLMAQPEGADGGYANTFDVFFRPSQGQSIVQMNSGGPINVAAGKTEFLYQGGALGGPVAVKSAGAGMVSERSLFGNSFEEVWGMVHDELDSHYWWPMYDGYSAGMKNWVLVSNPPENCESIEAKVVIHIPPEYGGDEVLYSPALAPGETWTPQFPGLMGGPVEVKTWRHGGSESNPADARKSVASQRVLYNGSFNELPGIAASRLDYSYIWTWYDDVSPGAKNWIMMANPDPYKTIYVWIGMGGGHGGGDGGGPVPEEFMPINPSETVSLRDDELIGGPVIVFSCYDPYDCETTAAPIVASQRLLWGPSG